MFTQFFQLNWFVKVVSHDSDQDCAFTSVMLSVTLLFTFFYRKRGNFFLFQPPGLMQIDLGIFWALRCPCRVCLPAVSVCFGNRNWRDLKMHWDQMKCFFWQSIFSFTFFLLLQKVKLWLRGTNGDIKIFIIEENGSMCVYWWPAPNVNRTSIALNRVNKMKSDKLLRLFSQFLELYWIEKIIR